MKNFCSKSNSLLLTLAILVAIAQSSTSTATTDPALSDSEIFDIEIMDKTKQKDEIYKIAFSTKDGKIGKTRSLMLMYKYLIDENYERVMDIEQRHAKGENLSQREEDIHVGAHLVQFYYKTLMEEMKGDRVSVEEMEDVFGNEDKYKEFLTENHKEIVKELDESIKDNPLVIGEADMKMVDHIEDEEDDDEFFGLDL